MNDEHVAPGIIRWENPYGEEPDFAATLRKNPSRWALVYEGSGSGWTSSHEFQWLMVCGASNEPPGFSYMWVQIDTNGKRVSPKWFALKLEMQSKGRAYVRYDPPGEEEE